MRETVNVVLSLITGPEITLHNGVVKYFYYKHNTLQYGNRSTTSVFLCNEMKLRICKCIIPTSSVCCIYY